MRPIVLTAILLSAAPALGAPKKKPLAASEQKQGKAQPPPVDPKLKGEAIAAKYMFISRVELCAPPQRCDRVTLTVVDDAEKRFVDACRACASEEKCEEDRAKIRAGKGERSYSPCD